MDLYTKVFISCQEDKLLSVVKSLGVLRVGDTVFYKSSTLYLCRNEEYDEEKSTLFPDGFLYFPYLLEMDFQEKHASQESAVGIVSSVLRSLWGNRITAIASTDMEQYLPFSGGYNNVQVPWIRR